MSQSNSAIFGNEKVGDVVVFATDSSQNILLGNQRSGKPSVQITSNTVDVDTTLNCAQFVQSYGLTLSLGTTMLPTDLKQLQESADYVDSTRKAAFSSNLITQIYSPESNIATLPETHVSGLAAFSNQVNMSQGLGVLGNALFYGPSTVVTGVAAFSNQVNAANNLRVLGQTSLAATSVGTKLTVGGASSNTTHAVNVTGSIHASGDVTSLSDSNLKTNFDVIPNALNKVLALNGYTFEMREQLGVRRTGLIAQEVMSVLPEAITEGPDGLSVSYGNVVGLLINAIKELDAKLQARSS
jgi:hypothetical protein